MRHGLALVCLIYATCTKADPYVFNNYHHISFDGIRPTIYELKDNNWHIKVNSSSSFILVPFESPRTIRNISFLWKKDGTLNIDGPKRQTQKSGDDSYLKLGFMTEGRAPLIPFFAPSWIKAVRKFTKLSSDKLIYHLFGGPKEPGSEWNNPYSSDVKMRSIASMTRTDGWNEANYTSKITQKITGFWIMADGDNTKSSFQTWLKALYFH